MRRPQAAEQRHGTREILVNAQLLELTHISGEDQRTDVSRACREAVAQCRGCSSVGSSQCGLQLIQTFRRASAKQRDDPAIQIALAAGP